MQTVTDHIGNTIVLDALPKRIVSLVPSQTELLHYLGLSNEVVAITKFCIHPDEWYRNKTRIGGTKDIHIAQIKDLTPDLIIANKEENVQAQVEALSSFAPVYTSDVNNLQEACSMIQDIGILTGKATAADALVAAIQQAFQPLQTSMSARIKVAYLIWRNPYMTVGGDTFISHMMQQAGFVNVFGDAKRYPEVTIEQISHRGCEVLLLSSEPYPFAEKHLEELSQALPRIRIMLVDGEMFSWYGNRMLKAPAYFQWLVKQIALR